MGVFKCLACWVENAGFLDHLRRIFASSTPFGIVPFERIDCQLVPWPIGAYMLSSDFGTLAQSSVTFARLVRACQAGKTARPRCEMSACSWAIMDPVIIRAVLYEIATNVVATLLCWTTVVMLKRSIRRSARYLGWTFNCYRFPLDTPRHELGSNRRFTCKEFRVTG